MYTSVQLLNDNQCLTVLINCNFMIRSTKNCTQKI